MSQMSANMLKPIFAALPAEERRAFAEWIQEQEKGTALKPKKRKRTTLDKVADQLGEQFRPGNEDMLLSEIINGK